VRHPCLMQANAVVDQRLADLVGRYSSRIRGAVSTQHERESVCSPLGVWLVLCAAAVGAEGEQRERLEDAVGCSAEEASRLLDSFISDGPEALVAAVALWVRGDDTTPAFARCAARLPDDVEIGPMPSQDDADRWARRNTLELIRRFPGEVAELEVCLASAVATRVSWREPFAVARVRDTFSATSPWRDAVQENLLAVSPSYAAIVETERAGVVAVFEAVAQEELTVVCVSAAPDVARERVLDAAQEVAGHVRGGVPISGYSLFDLPVGEGHSWLLTERERPASEPGERFEQITAASLPAWTIQSSLDLLASDVFAADLATGMLQDITGKSGSAGARQTAVATFDRYGFEAAAVTGSRSSAVWSRRSPA
jgi:hypothetical protein